MKFDVDLNMTPELADMATPEQISVALAKILNADLVRFWGTSVTVVPAVTS